MLECVGMCRATWRYLSEKVPVDIKEWREILLHNRGLKGLAQQEAFFTGRDPLEITLREAEIDKTQVKKALRRILRAVAAGEKVLIFGDYDVDGNCATAIVWQTLNLLGLTATPFIPHRSEHGYGMNERSFQAVCNLDFKPSLIISVDNGIVATPIIQRFIDGGTDVVITDHHEPEIDKAGDIILPPGDAVVHTTILCGAGVAWFLCRELLREAVKKELLAPAKANRLIISLLSLVALATVVDQVSSLGVNRHLIKAGLQAMRDQAPVGLQKLCQISNLEPSALDEDDLGFKIGPRINAIGRLSNTLDGVRLLCTNSAQKAAQLAAVLNQTNSRRQELTDELLDLARSQIDRKKLPQVVVVHSEQFHEGIIGLIASRLVDELHRPVIAVAVSSDIAKGSARSVPGVNIIELLRLARANLTELGGHSMAAGFSARQDKLNAFIKDLNTLAKQKISAQCLTPQLILDHPANVKLLTDSKACDLLASFAPHGVDNECVQVSLTGQVVKTYPLGAQNQHLKFLIKDESSKNLIQVLQWRAANCSYLPILGDQVNLAARLEINHFREQTSVQLIALDWQIPDAAVAK